MEGYLVKADRGRANRDSSVADVGYWVERNFCDVEDRSVLALDCRAERATLAADPVLGPLHAQAVRWRQERFLTLMTEEPWRAFFGRLLMCGPTRLLSAEEARLVWRHGAGLPGRS